MGMCLHLNTNIFSTEHLEFHLRIGHRVVLYRANLIFHQS